MKDTPRFLWDANAPRDPKVLRLRARFGMEGYGVFQALTCAMREEESYSISINDLDIYAASLGVDFERLKAIVSCCLEVNLFQSEPGDMITASALKERMKEWDARKERRSSAAKVARGVQLQKVEQCSLKVEQSPNENEKSPVVDRRSNTIQYNTIQTNTKQSNETEPPPAQTEHERAAEASLEPPGEQPWTLRNEFINAGRRPMRNYPEIMISVPDLAETLRQFDVARLPKLRAKEVFKTVEAAMNDPNAFGQVRPPKNPFLWLTGWALKAKLEQLKTEIQIEHTEERHAERRTS